MSNQDARVRYTRMMVENNFLKILKEKPLSKITVTEICQAAQINRATFYKHYADVSNVLEQMEENLLSELKQLLEAPVHEGITVQSLQDVMCAVLRYVQECAGKYMLLGMENADPALPTKTFEIIYERFFPELMERFPQIPLWKREMMYHYLTLGCGGILTNWIANGMQTDCKEVADYIIQISISTVSTLEQ